MKLRHHTKEHEIFSSYKNALERNLKGTPKPKSKPATNVVEKIQVMNCYLDFLDENRAKVKEDRQ